MMVRVYLRGGLGNQFFQWQHALRLAHSGQRVALDTSFLRRRRHNQARGRLELGETFSSLQLPVRHTAGLHVAERLVSRLARWGGLLAGDPVDPGAPPAQRPRPLQYGYFQRPIDAHDPALAHARTALRSELSPLPALPQPYAAMHLRLGDYGALRYNRTQLGVLGIDYYRAALAQLATHGPQRVLVVSDDYTAARALCRALASDATAPLQFLDTALGGRDTPTLALRALLHAQQLVCANSSFSAMAAYVGHAQQVFAPRPWLRSPRLAHLDPCASTWIRVAACFAHTGDAQG
jgi:hypothetical protein